MALRVNGGIPGRKRDPIKIANLLGDLPVNAHMQAHRRSDAFHIHGIAHLDRFGHRIMVGDIRAVRNEQRADRIVVIDHDMRRTGGQLLAGFRIDQHSLNLHVDAVERFPQRFRQLFGRLLAQNRLQANLKHVYDALGIHLVNFILVEPAVNHIGQAGADEP